ncbi:hypothetical protein M2351_005342 [Azospirillum canadense]|nr:hypothetical protein [Azospirillum canadense]
MRLPAELLLRSKAVETGTVSVIGAFLANEGWDV